MDAPRSGRMIVAYPPARQRDYVRSDAYFTQVSAELPAGYRAAVERPDQVAERVEDSYAMPRLEPLAVGGVMWLPQGGDAAKDALKTTYRGGDE